MDNNIIVAIISGTASIISTALGVRITATRASGQGYLPHLLGWKPLGMMFSGAAIAALLAALLFSRYGTKTESTFRQNLLLPDSRYEEVASNGRIRVAPIDLARPGLPPNIPIYGEDLPPGELGEATEVQLVERTASTQLDTSDLGLSQALIYESIRGVPGSFTICRFLAKEPVNVNKTAGLRLILWADHDDKLELGLKNEFDAEVKPWLNIHAGWAAYDIPFRGFGSVSYGKVIEFHVAFSKLSRPNNKIMIAKIVPHG
jgi:hypothetical protein